MPPAVARELYQQPAGGGMASVNQDLKRSVSGPTTENDFLDFIRQLLRLALTPVTLPLRLIHRAMTSPLTLSLVLRLILLGFLFLASAMFSVLAVGAFFWSWSTGGSVEVEGWLFYGSKNHRTPHVTVPLPVDKFYEDLRYDVQLELELVRPARGAPEDLGNFMLSLDLRSSRDPQLVIVTAAQPSLPPPPLQSSLLSVSLTTLPTYLLPPCVIPWPFRSMCPSRLLGYGGKPNSKIRERRIKGGFSSPAKGKDVVLLKKELMEGVLLKSARAPEANVGSAFVSIGREDSFGDTAEAQARSREVKTTGWVVVRFVPRPTGIRWLLSSHPLPPLLLLPPVSLSLSLTSSIFACGLITCLRGPKRRARTRSRSRDRSREPEKEKKAVTAASVQSGETSEQTAPTAQSARASNAHESREREADDARGREDEEWEAVEDVQSRSGESSTGKGLNSTVGESETTGSSSVRSFGPTIDSDSETTTSTETVLPSTVGRGRRISEGLGDSSSS